MHTRDFIPITYLSLVFTPYHRKNETSLRSLVFYALVTPGFTALPGLHRLATARRNLAHRGAGSGAWSRPKGDGCTPQSTGRIFSKGVNVPPVLHRHEEHRCCSHWFEGPHVVKSKV